MQAEEERKLDAIEAGQSKIRNSGGRGLLAYIEGDEDKGLASTLGGAAQGAAPAKRKLGLPRSMAEAASA